jgi:hypothetical protein
MIRLVALLACLNSSMAIAEIPAVYSQVAAQHQVPALLLYAVCLQEAGRQVNGHFHPWPWTVNIQGQGHYLDSAESALAVVNSALENTCRVDIGLCQIHWCAHAQSFTAPADALHPHVNLHYAASILRREYEFTVNQGTPSWWLAVGRYHHPSNHSLASAYRQRVYQRWLPLAQVSP